MLLGQLRQNAPVPLEVADTARHFLHEEVEVSVAVGVHQLGTGRVEAAEEGELERPPRGVGDGKGEDVLPEGGCGTCAVR